MAVVRGAFLLFDDRRFYFFEISILGGFEIITFNSNNGMVDAFSFDSRNMSFQRCRCFCFFNVCFWNDGRFGSFRGICFGGFGRGYYIWFYSARFWGFFVFFSRFRGSWDDDISFAAALRLTTSISFFAIFSAPPDFFFATSF